MRHLITIGIGLFLLTACDSLTGQSDDEDFLLHSTLELRTATMDNLDDMHAEYTVTNRSDSRVTYGFSSGCQRRFRIHQGYNVKVDSRSLYFCTMAITYLRLDPGESRTYVIRLDRSSLDIELEPGEYKITASLIDVEDSEISASFTIE